LVVCGGSLARMSSRSCSVTVSRRRSGPARRCEQPGGCCSDVRNAPESALRITTATAWEWHWPFFVALLRHAPYAAWRRK
jgi:hypothetical protein